MAHPAQLMFCYFVKSVVPGFFKGKRILDIGSLNVNGCNREMFTDCAYTGVDLQPGSNVDIVAKGHEVNLPDASFDVVISTECFEHDMHVVHTMRNMYRMLCSGGLFLFTAAGPRRQEHGTRRTQPQDSPFTSSTEEWSDYYKNITIEMVDEIFDPLTTFAHYSIGYVRSKMDIQFWGVKK